MAAQFDRLLSEQQSAIQMTDAKIVQLTKFSQDYASLKPKLDDLAKCFTRQVLIPFSPRALVPATLIHTNEVLVHLGGDQQHFAELSTFQALQLLDRRVERIENEIKKLQDQRKLLSDRETFTNKFNLQGQAFNEEVEIKEEYNAEQEEEWLRRHKANVQAEKRLNTLNKPVSVRFAGDSDSSSTSSYEESLIEFRHSQHPASPVVTDIIDWSKASPADVSAMVQKHIEANKRSTMPASCLKKKSCLPTVLSGDIGPSKNDFTLATKPPSQESIHQQCSVRKSPISDVVEHEHPTKIESPFSDVVERKDLAPLTTVAENVDSGKPVSRFRVLRKKQS